jgi:hypothetical protein
MSGGTASRTHVLSIMSGGRVAFISLPSSADLLSIFCPESFSDVLGGHLMLTIPGVSYGALNGVVLVPAQAYCTIREGARCKVCTNSVYLLVTSYQLSW